MVRKKCIYSTEDELLAALCQELQVAANDSIQTRDIFTVGLSGSSMVHQLAKILPQLCTNWSKWRFFFCDERIVPFHDNESTYGAYLKAFRGTVDVSEEQFVSINPNLTAEEAAKDYVRKISAFFPNQDIPEFDVLLLGMGPDGHTCSLFPNHPLLNETSRWVAPITNSPKPPPNRITLTYSAINNARSCIFIVLGENKATAVKEIFEGNKELPAGRVFPLNGNVLWLMDKEAASMII